jgi:hypothetical protein
MTNLSLSRLGRYESPCYPPLLRLDQQCGHTGRHIKWTADGSDDTRSYTDRMIVVIIAIKIYHKS